MGLSECISGLFHASLDTHPVEIASMMLTFPTLKDLQPAIVNGWYWAPTGKRIPAPRKCRYCEWSRSGGLKKPQPDNREAKQGGKDEGCIGILNNFYSDGIKWHDIECRHKKPIICQESDELLDFAFGEEN